MLKKSFLVSCCIMETRDLIISRQSWSNSDTAVCGICGVWCGVVMMCGVCVCVCGVCVVCVVWCV